MVQLHQIASKAIPPIPGSTTKMNIPPIQQPTPPPHTPSLRQPSVAPTKGMFRQEQPDKFLILLQGPSVTFVLTTSPSLSPHRYTLPVALLCHYSHYFKVEINRLSNASSSASNKKRKIDNVSTATIQVVDEEPKEKIDTTKEKELVMHLDDVDHTAFGLFLRFIYTGKYPSEVDAPPHIGKGTSESPYAITPDSIIVPVSVNAYLLAQRLGSAAFMNHAIWHIHAGLGKYFALTPALMDLVWTATGAAVTVTGRKDVKLGVALVSKTFSPSCPNITPSPLRRLLLDSMIVHWPNHTSGQVISRMLHQRGAWNALFDKHGDLRGDFIFGLQGKGKMGGPEGYYVVSVGRAESVKREGGLVG